MTLAVVMNDEQDAVGQGDDALLSGENITDPIGPSDFHVIVFQGLGKALQGDSRDG